MSQNQKFTLLVFTLVLIVGVVLVYMNVRGSIDSML